MMRVVSVALVFLFMCFAGLSSTAQASSQTTVWDTLTVCEYVWYDQDTDWRSHTWKQEDCSNGLPGSNFLSIGQSVNLKGKASMAECNIPNGRLFNSAAFNGTDAGVLKCLYFDPSEVDANEITRCTYGWSVNDTGWRWRDWVGTDCSNGVPTAGAVSIGQGLNGFGTSGQVECSTSQGGHYNNPSFPGSTNGYVACLYINLASLSAMTKPTIVYCSASFPSYVTGKRVHHWNETDCTGGYSINWNTSTVELHPGYMSIGQSINGNGTVGQVECSTLNVSHYNDPNTAGATNGIAKCVYVLPPKYYLESFSTSTPYKYDLDEDSVNDTNLSLVECTNSTGDTCLSVVSKLMNNEQAEEFALFPGAIDSTNNWATSFGLKDSFRLIGDHTGDGIQEISIHHAFEKTGVIDNKPLPVISIIDGSRGVRLVDQPFPDPLDYVFTAGCGAFTDDPIQYYCYPVSTGSSYAGHPKGPDGKRYPYLAPGFQVYGDWNHICVFRPTLPNKQGKCEPGFVEIPISINLHSSPSSPSFRDLGAVQHDLNDDGWGDISLIYRYGYVSLDTKNLVQFKSPAPTFDVFPGTVTHGEPRQTKLNNAATVWSEFHGGRFYGMNKALTTTSEEERILVIAGDSVQVRSANDEGFPQGLNYAQCGVSRYIAMVKNSFNNGNFEQDLLWSNYRGHYSTINRYPNTANEILVWDGDLVNECIHHPSDGISKVDGTDVVVFNVFTTDYTVTSKPATCTPKDNESSLQCKIDVLNQPGTWGFQALDFDDGRGITGGTEVYIWGMSDKILPGGEMAYITEHVPEGSPFNFYADTTNVIHVYTIENSKFVSQGTILGNIRPKLEDQKHTDAISSGHQSIIFDLILEDRNKDGFMDFQLADDTWAAVVQTGVDENQSPIYEVQTFP